MYKSMLLGKDVKYSWWQVPVAMVIIYFVIAIRR